MTRTILVAALAIGLLSIPGIRAQPDAVVIPVATTADKIVAILQEQRFSYEKDLQTTPFREVLEDMARRYGVIFIVNKTAIGDMSARIDTAKAEKLTVIRTEGLLLATFFEVYLRALPIPDLTYLVRADHVEITTREAAQKEAGLLEAVEEAKASEDKAEAVRAKARLGLPLICVAAKERSLAGVFKELSTVYGLNVVVETSAREALKTAITQQLLNVPADTALELLAGQAGLAVVRKGNTFRVTSNGQGAQ